MSLTGEQGGGFAGVWGDTGTPDFSAVLGTADDGIAGMFLNNGGFPSIFAENSTEAAGAEVFYAYIGSVAAPAIIGDPGCNVGFVGLQLAQGGMSGCSNYTMAGGNNGHTYINAVTGAAVHLRINSVDQLVATSGNVDVLGTLSKGGGSFKIDHPLDPANKYLYQSFVESPDMMNIYNGVATLSKHGDAVVQLPQWFNALNRDFRYQLTCIGGFAPVYIASEVSGNQFKIGGGRPGMKVSWQVTGIRQDAFANEHRIPVEEDKEGNQ
jgi:hypothetical protein